MIHRTWEFHTFVFYEIWGCLNGSLLTDYHKKAIKTHFTVDSQELGWNQCVFVVHPDVLMRMIHSLHWCFLTELINSRIESAWTHGKRHPGVISPPRSINLLFIDFPMFSFLRSAVSSGWEKKNKDPPHQMLLEKPLSLWVLQTGFILS